jgi:flagellar motor switch protein FliN/FliY
LAGRRALAGAGVQEVSEEEARATWIELLNQAFSAMAQQLSELAGESVSAANGKVAPGPPPQGEPQLAELSLAGREAIRLRMVISGDLEAAAEKWLAGPPPAESPALRPPPGREDHSYKTLDLLKDVELPVSVSFGRTQLPLQDVLKLTAGSVIELDRTIDEPVALIVNDTVVALGEVVVVEGNYGVRIQKIMSREDLLRTSGFR